MIKLNDFVTKCLHSDKNNMCNILSILDFDEIWNTDVFINYLNEIIDKNTILKNYIEYQPTLSLYHICDDFIEDALKEELLKKTNADEVKALMSHLNLPLKFNLDQLAKRELLKTENISSIFE